MQFLGPVIVLGLLVTLVNASDLSFSRRELQQYFQLAQVVDISPAPGEAAPASAPVPDTPVDIAPAPASETAPANQLTPEGTPQENGGQPSEEAASGTPNSGQPENNVSSTQNENLPLQESSTNKEVPGVSTPEATSSSSVPSNESDQRSASDQALPAAPALIVPDEIITNVNQISSETVEKAKIEESQIAAAKTPEAQSALIISFADEKVDDISASLRKSNFAEVDFLIQRLNDQIDQAIDSIKHVSPEAQEGLRKKLVKFSREADADLRTQELLVPEELEQDMEISRAKLLFIQSQ